MLPEERRQQLDGIVQQMIQNKETDVDIQFVVNDFKTKYDVKQAAPKQSFLSNANASLVKRGVNIADELTPKGNESLGATLVKAPRRAFRTIGQAAGLVGDIGGELLKSGYETLVPESTQETIKTGLKNVGNTALGQMGINAAKSGYESYQTFKKNYPDAAKDLEATVNIASLLPMGKAATLVKPAAKEAVNIGRDAVSLVKAGTRKAVKKAIPEDMPQKVLESGAKWSTTLSPEVRKNLSNTMMEEGLNLNPKGYDKLKTSIDDINNEIKSALEPYKDTPIDADSVIKRTSEALKKAEKSYDPATETAKVNEEVGKFLENWGGKLTVSDAQSIKQDIYKQLKSHYDSVSKGGTGKYTDGEIAAKKNIARGLKEEIENAVEDAPIKDLNARETKLLKLEPHLRRAVGRIENHNILSRDDVLAGGVGTILGGMTGGGVGAAIGAAAAGVAKRALGHPGTKSKIANALYGIKNSTDAKLVPKSALGQKIEGVLSKQPVEEAGQTLNYALGPVKSGVNVGAPYGPEAPRLIKPKQLPAGQGFELGEGNVIDVPFKSYTKQPTEQYGNRAGKNLQLPPVQTKSATLALPAGQGFRLEGQPYQQGITVGQPYGELVKPERPINAEFWDTRRLPAGQPRLALPAGKTIPGEDFVMREAPPKVILRKPYTIGEVNPDLQVEKTPYLTKGTIQGNKNMKGSENGYINKALADLKEKEINPGTVRESHPDIQRSVVEQIRSQGLIKAGSEDAALKEMMDFFDEMAGKVNKVYNEAGELVSKGAKAVQEKMKDQRGSFSVKEKGEPNFKTGKSVTFDYIHNREKSPNMGSRFGQDVEPAGKYIQTKPRTFEGAKNWEVGTITFKNPLVIDFGGGYGEKSNWKNVLSEKYGGKTGRRLTNAILNDGYDGIVTIGKYGSSEIVTLHNSTTPARLVKPPTLNAK